MDTFWTWRCRGEFLLLFVCHFLAASELLSRYFGLSNPSLFVLLRRWNDCGLWENLLWAAVVKYLWVSVVFLMLVGLSASPQRCFLTQSKQKRPWPRPYVTLLRPPETCGVLWRSQPSNHKDIQPVGFISELERAAATKQEGWRRKQETQPARHLVTWTSRQRRRNKWSCCFVVWREN